jgi:diguanylate cyclase (GGDEF)-like protein
LKLWEVFGLKRKDVVGRWGGEEFMVILNYTDINMAKNLAERIRKTIAAIDFEEIGSITASFGVVSVEQNDNEIQVYKRVDGALYKAKKSGRNKVVTA